MAEGIRGTIIRDANGTLYFLRDEILEECKVTEPEIAAFCSELLDEHTDEVSGFAMAAWNTRVSASITFEGPFAKSGLTSREKGSGGASGTLVCPTIFSKDQFVVDPSARFST